MICKNCGMELSDEAKFCSNCGTPVTREEIEETQEIKEESTQRIDEAEDVKEEPAVEDLKPASELESEASDVDKEPEDSQEDPIQWYYVKGSEAAGPFEEKVMQELIEKKEIGKDTLVWKNGFEDWKKLGETELSAYLSQPEVKDEPQSWYYIDANGNQNGPYTKEQMENMVRSKQIYGNTFVWKTGMPDWKRLKETELAGLAQACTDSVYSGANQPIYISERSIGMCILLSIVTCSIYSYYWLYCLANDIERCCQAKGKASPGDPGMVVLLTIVTCGLYGIYFYWKAGKVLNELDFDNGFKVPDNSIVMLVLPIVGLGIISMAICQSSLNDISRYGNQ